MTAKAEALEANTQGRRPTGPGWFWYTGTLDGLYTVDEPVRVFDWQEPDEETSRLWAAGTVIDEYPIDAMPGDFVPLTKPIAAPEPVITPEILDAIEDVAMCCSRTQRADVLEWIDVRRKEGAGVDRRATQGGAE